MLMYQIIEALEQPQNSVLIESLLPYKSALHLYYSDRFTSEPALMVTSVSNAVQYARIEPLADLAEAAEQYVHTMQLTSEEDREQEMETIFANSITLIDL